MEKELEEEPSRVQGPERESNFLFFNTAPENKLGERSSVPRFVLSGKEKVEETREKIAELFGLAKKPKKNGSKGIAGESEEKDEEKSEVEEEGLSQQNQNYYFLAYSIIDSLKFVAESREGKILVDYFRDPDSGKLEEAATILAKANFDVEILRGNGTLGGDSDGFFSRKISALCEKLEENYRVPDNSDETGDQKKEKTTIEPSHIATVPPGGAEDLSGSSRKKLNRECLEKKLAADMAKLFGAEVNGTTTIRAESRDGNALIYSMAGLDGAAQDSRVELFDENTFSAMEKLPERCLADGKNITGGAAKDSAIGNLAGTLVALSYLNDKDGIGSGGQNIALVDGNIVLNGLGESFRSGDN
ncbi:MAG: hypothetical protein LBU15_00425, partial [Rickettsiales bacterium]|nr:hypothetical protein [Rickettsiales bacterium]